jgi:hypothetical protein
VPGLTTAKEEPTMRPGIHLPAAIATGGLLLALSAAPALATTTPVDNGCPASTQLYSVAWLESQGPYQLPARLDDPANGGNGDGYVCAFPLPQAMADAMGADHTIYQFFENNLAAEGRP